MRAKKKFAMAVAALLVGTMLMAPVQAAETLKLSEVSHLHGIAVDPTDPWPFGYRVSDTWPNPG